MELVRTDLAAVALLIGVLALAVATALPMRREPAGGGRRHGHGRVWLVSRLGGSLTLLLLVRGATAGAVAIGAATVAHAVFVRVRGAVARR